MACGTQGTYPKQNNKSIKVIIRREERERERGGGERD